jgi:PfaD family protein
LTRSVIESGSTNDAPVATDVTVEADSGGHTDNRPALALLPTILALRDRLGVQHGWSDGPRVGVGGGIGTPAAVAASFGMGAAYEMTGSINQGCREAGTSDRVRELLAAADVADVAMAAAADMFELGVRLQVLKRGTMFAMRANKLYELWRAYPSLEALPAPDRDMLERTIFRAPLSEISSRAQAFWLQREPLQAVKAQGDPHHAMALAFRWYLGMSSRWANAGDPERVLDYQIWCGPAMGAFNEWTRGSPLEAWQARKVVDVATHLMAGAAHMQRAQWLRQQGFDFGSEQPSPRTIAELEEDMS